jgi:hypothetical protein
VGTQVVHLYAELRKVMPETMEVSYATAEPLRPGGIKLKLMLADSDAPNGTAEVQPVFQSSFGNPPVDLTISGTV